MTGGSAVEKKHSGLGIASLIIGTTVGVLMFLLFVVAGVLEASTPGGLDEDSAEALVVGVLLIGFLFLEVLAIGLGIAGLLQAERHKLFAVLGVVFSAATIVTTMFLVILGLLS